MPKKLILPESGIFVNVDDKGAVSFVYPDANDQLVAMNLPAVDLRTLLHQLMPEVMDSTDISPGTPVTAEFPFPIEGTLYAILRFHTKTDKTEMYIVLTKEGRKIPCRREDLRKIEI